MNSISQEKIQSYFVKKEKISFLISVRIGITLW